MIFALFALAAFAVLAGGADSCSDSGSKSSKSGKNGGSNEATSDNTPHVGPNKSVRVDAIVYRVKSATTAKTLGDPSIGTGQTADGVFVVVKLKAHSNKNESATLSDDTFKLSVPNGPEYSADTEGSTAALLSSGSGDSQEPFFLRDIQPDTTTSGVVVYDVPRSVLRKKPEMRFNELGFGDTHGYIGLPPLT